MHYVVLFTLNAFGILACAKEPAAYLVHDAPGSLHKVATRLIDKSVDNLLGFLLCKASKGSVIHTDLDGTMLGKRPSYLSTFPDDDLQNVVTQMVNSGVGLQADGNFRCTWVNNPEVPPKVDGQTQLVNGKNSALVMGAAEGWPPQTGSTIAINRFMGSSKTLGDMFCQAESRVSWPPNPALSVSSATTKGAWHASGRVHTAMYANTNLAGGLSVERTGGLIRPKVEGSLSVTHQKVPRHLAQFMRPGGAKSIQIKGQSQFQLASDKKIKAVDVGCVLAGPIAWPPQLTASLQASRKTRIGQFESTLQAPVPLHPEIPEMMGTMSLRRKLFGRLEVEAQLATSGEITCTLSGKAKRLMPLITWTQWQRKQQEDHAETLLSGTPPQDFWKHPIGGKRESE